MESKMKIEIWSDVMCPFFYIGKRNVELALSQFAEKQLIEIEWKSFQLDPSIPDVPEHQDDIYLFVSERKGFGYEQSKKIHQELVQTAKKMGLEYNFHKALVTNSLKAHRLMQFAKTKGLGEKAEERFFKAYFTEGKNVSDGATLFELGREIGLTDNDVNEALTNPIYKEKVEADATEAQSLGAKGVPFFVINRKYAISGSQPPSALLQNIEKAFSEWKKDNPAGLQIQEGTICKLNGDCD